MKTAAIVIDGWKLPIFKEGLDREGYQYFVHEWPINCYTLKVEVERVGELVPIVDAMNKAAAEYKKSKLN